MFIVSTAMYDAWSAFDEAARPVALDPALKRPVAEHTSQNKRAAVSYAAYYALLDQFEDYEDATGHFERYMTELELSVDAPEDEIPAEIGRRAAERIIEVRYKDGANEANNFRNQASDRYPERYQPRNSADPEQANAFGGPDFDPNRWTPLRVPTGVYLNAGFPEVDHQDERTYFDQEFTTPHWGAVVPFALSTSDQFRPSPPPQLGLDTPYTDGNGITTTNDDAFRAQFAELVTLSSTLTETQKVIAEYWADGPRTESPPGHWNQLAHGVSTRDAHTVDEDIKLYFALNAALLDASIACWEAKRHYDFVRPVTAIHHLYAGQTIRAWAGPDLGVQDILGSAWRPYQDVRFVTPPFAEYVSGHSAFSRAAAEVLTLFTGSELFYDGVSKTHQDIDGDGIKDLLGQFIQAPYTSTFERVPSAPVVLQWSTFVEAADQAGYSRRLGGIHIQDGDLNGRQLGRETGAQAFARARDYWEGRD